jgi:hypothetical protein
VAVFLFNISGPVPHDVASLKMLMPNLPHGNDLEMASQKAVLRVQAPDEGYRDYRTRG